MPSLLTSFHFFLDIPKFLAQDVPLFQAIVSDLFPGVHLPEHDYGELLVSIKSNLGREGFQQGSTFFLILSFHSIAMR